MCYALKYGIWNVGQPQQEAVNALTGSDCAPLLAMVLSSRGIRTPQEANNYLACDCSLADPYLMTDMKSAVQRLRTALEKNEIIARLEEKTSKITAAMRQLEQRYSISNLSFFFTFSVPPFLYSTLTPATKTIRKI